MFTCEWSKQLIHSCEWKMQHNCSSLSGLNYVLLAREQVNNTSSVYCSDQPCHLNRRLTKERGNPQFADNVSQELANSNYMAKEGPQVNFAWHSARLIKGAFASSDWLYLLLWEECCGGVRARSALIRSEVSSPTSLPSQSWGALLCSVGLWCLRCPHGLQSGWFYFLLIVLDPLLDPQVYMYKAINLNWRPSLFIRMFMTTSFCEPLSLGCFFAFLHKCIFLPCTKFKQSWDN